MAKRRPNNRQQTFMTRVFRLFSCNGGELFHAILDTRGRNSDPSANSPIRAKHLATETAVAADSRSPGSSLYGGIILASPLDCSG